MSRGKGLTANQNSIPENWSRRRRDACRQPGFRTVSFHRMRVPEGTRASVEGMTHGCILAKFKNGFHKLGIPGVSMPTTNLSVAVDGGGSTGRRVHVAGYVTLISLPSWPLPKCPRIPTPKPFGATRFPRSWSWPASGSGKRVCQRPKRSSTACLCLARDEENEGRDDKYRAIREKNFTTKISCEYLRELSSTKLPGLTTPETTAVMLALSFEMGMGPHFMAPAFGFQKNIRIDNDQARKMVGRSGRFANPSGFPSVFIRDPESRRKIIRSWVV